ncbi:5'-3' exoribonuclease [Kipferlia bialata]|uniref:5'-3' exoribonuclease n=1 Tax=Kipferlia bialata TaxID=797122 RepID=A0A9K3CNJ1_9EUKA|nr:5'-3' exoribonuclease [Kipferlia bialata]|eukprot:g107.t1
MDTRVAGICQHYIDGLRWVLKYYYVGCTDWGWCYPEHYAPMITDIARCVPAESKFDHDSQPFPPYAQLLGVLPPSSAGALPLPLQSLLRDKDSPLAAIYPRHFTLDMVGKRREWQAVARLPLITDGSVITRELDKRWAEVADQLTEDDHHRNTLTCPMVYVNMDGTAMVSQYGDAAPAVQQAALKKGMSPEDMVPKAGHVTFETASIQGDVMAPPEYLCSPLMQSIPVVYKPCVDEPVGLNKAVTVGFECDRLSVDAQHLNGLPILYTLLPGASGPEPPVVDQMEWERLGGKRKEQSDFLEDFGLNRRGFGGRGYHQQGGRGGFRGGRGGRGGFQGQRGGRGGYQQRQAPGMGARQQFQQQLGAGLVPGQAPSHAPGQRGYQGGQGQRQGGYQQQGYQQQQRYPQQQRQYQPQQQQHRPQYQQRPQQSYQGQAPGQRPAIFGQGQSMQGQGYGQQQAPGRQPQMGDRKKRYQADW